jgi:agmatinase
MSFMRLPFASTLFVVVHALIASAHYSDSSKSESWSEKYGSQGDLVFTGPLAFSHLPYHRCLEDGSPVFDIAVLGMPFDTAVTYRPGARFGPTGIRIGSRRIHDRRTWSLSWGLDPYQQGLKIIDCGDVCVALLKISFPCVLGHRSTSR